MANSSNVKIQFSHGGEAWFDMPSELIGKCADMSVGEFRDALPPTPPVVITVFVQMKGDK